jgi:hypothetical protein
VTHTTIIQILKRERKTFESRKHIKKEAFLRLSKGASAFIVGDTIYTVKMTAYFMNIHILPRLGPFGVLQGDFNQLAR